MVLTTNKIYDPSESCPKCGSTEHKVQWQRPGKIKFAPLLPSEDVPEHISIDCARCGFRWARHPVSKDVENEPPNGLPIA